MNYCAVDGCTKDPLNLNAQGGGRPKKGAKRYCKQHFPLPRCQGCARFMRPAQGAAKDWPDAVKRRSGRYCVSCHVPKPTPSSLPALPPCADCEVPMRPWKGLLEDWPGTKARGGGGLCTGCVARKRLGGRFEEYPHRDEDRETVLRLLERTGNQDLEKVIFGV